MISRQNFSSLSSFSGLTRLSLREKILMISTILLGFVYLFHTYFMQPLWNSYQLQKDELKSQTAELQRLKGVDQQQLNRQIAELKTKLEKDSVRVPDTPQTAEALYYLQEKAAKAGVDHLLAVQTSEPPQAAAQITAQQQPQEQGTIIPMEVETEGSYSNTLNFLRELEAFPRLAKVMGINWKYEEGKLTGRFQVNVYSLATSVPAKGPGPIPQADNGPGDPFAAR